MRRALTPSRSETRLDNLIWASSADSPVGSVTVPGCASSGTFGASPCATGAVRPRAQSLGSAPVPLAASPVVRHPGNPSSGPVDRDWTVPAPDVTVLETDLPE